MELRKTFQFEAAHLLPHLPEEHKCRRLHGHSFRAEIVVEGDCDPKLGWVIDYADITAAFKPLWEQLDHHYLNEIDGLKNPTSENVAIWIWERLKPNLPLLTAVEVAETRSGDCTEHSVLLAALLRSAGIPSRVVAGLVGYGKSLVGHMWTEVHIEEWVPLDATRGKGNVGADHIGLAVSSLAGASLPDLFLGIAPILGNVSIKLVEAPD